jgi:hypothetical protein
MPVASGPIAGHRYFGSPDRGAAPLAPLCLQDGPAARARNGIADTWCGAPRQGEPWGQERAPEGCWQPQDSSGGTDPVPPSLGEGSAGQAAARGVPEDGVEPRGAQGLVGSACPIQRRQRVLQGGDLGEIIEHDVGLVRVPL